MGDKMEIYGFVTSGIGEGEKYVSSEPYKSFFHRKLGCPPYPGTLNIKIDATTVQKFLEIATKEEFHENVGGLYYTKGEIEGESCVLVIPEKTNHQNILEVISCKNLRENLNLKDGELVKITCSILHL